MHNLGRNLLCGSAPARDKTKPSPNRPQAGSYRNNYRLQPRHDEPPRGSAPARDDQNNSPGYKSLRKGRVSIPSQIYLLTTVTHERTPLFTSHTRARTVCRVIHDVDSWLDAKLLCWVLMPDHWHGLLQLGDAATLGQIMNRWKAIATRTLHRAGHEGPVWQRGYHDHALRREEGVLESARYIVANPVRADLVKSVRQYPYWNSIWLDE